MLRCLQVGILTPVRDYCLSGLAPFDSGAHVRILSLHRQYRWKQYPNTQLSLMSFMYTLIGCICLCLVGWECRLSRHRMGVWIYQACRMLLASFRKLLSSRSPTISACRSTKRNGSAPSIMDFPRIRFSHPLNEDRISHSLDV